MNETIEFGRMARPMAAADGEAGRMFRQGPGQLRVEIPDEAWRRLQLREGDRLVVEADESVLAAEVARDPTTRRLFVRTWAGLGTSERTRVRVRRPRTGGPQ